MSGFDVIGERGPELAYPVNGEANDADLIAWLKRKPRGWVAPRNGGYSARATTAPHDPRIVPPGPGSASR